MNDVKKTISGWGLYPKADSFISRPEKIKDLQDFNPPCIARGLGRSYGDAAQLTNGQVVSTERLNRILAFDGSHGVVRAEAGVSFKDLLDVFVPLGWFPPVTPGTKWVSLGGGVAADIHGKNHHVDGSLGRFILGLELVLSDGSRVKCSPSQEADLFWATIGGMGLTGIISEVTLQLTPIQSGYIVVKNTPATNLDDLFDKMSDPSLEDRYSVAWIDCVAEGNEFGRGILMNGHHAILKELTASQQHPFRIKESKPRSNPFFFSGMLFSLRTIRKLNQLYFTYYGSKKEAALVDYDRYFYPLDVISNWNRFYGKKGFVQYQFVTPPGSSREVCRKVLSLLAEAKHYPYLAVLKRFGCEGEGLLSFPKEGYTLALDIPIKDNSLFPLLDRLDSIIIQNGGRVYLAKDARLSAASFRQMYPRLEEWMAVKKRVDFSNKFTSDQAKRLQI